MPFFSFSSLCSLSPLHSLPNGSECLHIHKESWGVWGMLPDPGPMRELLGGPMLWLFTSGMCFHLVPYSPGSKHTLTMKYVLSLHVLHFQETNIWLSLTQIHKTGKVLLIY